MRDKLVYGGLVVVSAVGLYALLRPLIGRLGFWDTWYVVFLIVPLALIVAARGESWRRRALFFSCALIAFVATDVVLAALGVQRLAEYGSSLASGGAAFTLTTLYHVFVTAFPIAVLVLFVGRDPERLWRARRAER